MLELTAATCQVGKDHLPTPIFLGYLNTILLNPTHHPRSPHFLPCQDALAMHCGDRRCEYQLDPRISMGLAQGVHKGPSFAIKSWTFFQSKILESCFNLQLMHLMLSGLLLSRSLKKKHLDKKRMKHAFLNRFCLIPQKKQDDITLLGKKLEPTSQCGTMVSTFGPSHLCKIQGERLKNSWRINPFWQHRDRIVKANQRVITCMLDGW